MQRIELCLTSGLDLGKVEEVVRVVQFMMPRIKLEFRVGPDERFVYFTCDSADNLTLSSAVLMLKRLLGEVGQVRMN